jgi:hypothetical protein
MPRPFIPFGFQKPIIQMNSVIVVTEVEQDI